MDDQHRLPLDEGPLGGRRQFLTFALLTTTAGVAFEALAVATIMPTVAAQLGGMALYGWAFSAFMLASLLGVAVAGGEVDRKGPLAPFVVGVILFVAGLVASGAAPTMVVLVAGRVVQGLGGGVVGAVVYAVVGRAYPEAAKARMVALLSSAWVVPSLLGPAIAGPVAEVAGWRWVFFGLIPLPALASLLAIPALRQMQGVGGEQESWKRVRHAAILVAGIATMLTGLGSIRSPFGPLAAAAGGTVALWALSRLTPPGTLRARPGLPAAIAAMALLNLVFFGVVSFLPLALVDLRMAPLALVATALTAGSVAWTLGSWVQAGLVDRLGGGRLLVFGWALLTVGAVLCALVLSPAVPAWLGPLGQATAGLGMGLAYATASLAVLRSAPVGQEGAATGAMQLAVTLGTALGPGLGGALVAASSAVGPGVGTPLLVQFLLMAGVAAAAIPLSARLPDLTRRPPSVVGRGSDKDGAPASSPGNLGLEQEHAVALG